MAPSAPDPHYNLACALARQGKPEAAMTELRAAAARGWTHSRHTLNDGDLKSLRENPDFIAFIAELQRNEKKLFEGDAIEGARTVTGDPEGGLRYRLRIDPAADKKRPARLVVWLHPSGASMNEAAEALVPVLLPRGYALLVFTDKNFFGWSAEDRARLMHTLTKVGRIEGLDARRPLLMGYSAGGQMAIQLWLATPGAWGGLILDAAYPLDLTKTAPDGEISPLVLPGAAEPGAVPMFVLVGEDDPGSALWRKAEAPWRAAGVPLRVLYVPGAGHTWLFDPAKMRDLNDWLAELDHE
jgi:predicted esterase